VTAITSHVLLVPDPDANKKALHAELLAICKQRK
jgi:hypothetical protein